MNPFDAFRAVQYITILVLTLCILAAAVAAPVVFVLHLAGVL